MLFSIIFSTYIFKITAKSMYAETLFVYVFVIISLGTAVVLCIRISFKLAGRFTHAHGLAN